MKESMEFYPKEEKGVNLKTIFVSILHKKKR